VEIGIPFSDPLADGPVIQHSSQVALKNGMGLKKLFEQLHGVREQVSIPLILMGYLNPVLQYGIKNFCEDCQKAGIDGVILPDLPVKEYMELYRDTFKQYGLHNIFLITPQTSEQRVRLVDELDGGFVYVVSSSSTTGAKDKIIDAQESYFKKIDKMGLNKPKLIGFGISNHDTFSKACNYANGAIIGSAFIKALTASNNLEENITGFVRDFQE
jgi:tryptophan synthase alpha chain